ncbi:hypothetical protein CGRA01v4_07685 [Colletotrichum graminicola]|nr:hypothetical protein CGRA01v4_07685 [Colletotrichum graminicola]
MGERQPSCAQTCLIWFSPVTYREPRILLCKGGGQKPASNFPCCPKRGQVGSSSFEPTQAFRLAVSCALGGGFVDTAEWEASTIKLGACVPAWCLTSPALSHLGWFCGFPHWPKGKECAKRLALSISFHHCGTGATGRTTQMPSIFGTLHYEAQRRPSLTRNLRMCPLNIRPEPLARAESSLTRATGRRGKSNIYKPPSSHLAKLNA